MKLFQLPLLALVFASIVLSSLTLRAEKVPDIAPGFALSDMQRLSDRVYVARLAPHLWVRTTIGKLDDGSLYTANGMLLEDGSQSILFDMGWTPEEARTLMEWARNILKDPVSKAYVTHLYNDRKGGAAALEAQHLPVSGTPLTIPLAIKTKQPTPDHSMTVPFTPLAVAKDAEILFPGAGHTLDNIIVEFPTEQIVFGGCFIKAGDSQGIGNTADADLGAWPVSLKRMQAVFPNPHFAVPGHGRVLKDTGQRTLGLLRIANSSAKQ
jgi:glyoxylase-like metal-dependent hydrolase (beta-lactamase superfamily II)